MESIGYHGERLLEVTGEAPASAVESPRLASFAWSNHGVTQPYLILMTGRCGSTWLASMVERAGLAGEPKEFFNSDVAFWEKAEPRNLPHYLELMAQKHTRNGRFGIQLDCDRLQDIGQLVDWPSLLSPASTPVFIMYRRDLLSQAWSWVSARKNNRWHSDKKADPATTDQVPNSDELAAEIVRLRTGEELLRAFCVEHDYTPRYLDYETLAAETATTMTAFYQQLGFDQDAIERALSNSSGSLSKLAYDAKAALLAEFATAHPLAMRLLHEERFTVSPGQLRTALETE